MTESPHLEKLGAMALAMHGAEEGVSCRNAAFSAGGKNFLFTGMQDGKLLIRLKLKERLGEAEALAAQDPEQYAVGKGGWVTARLAPTARLATRRWQQWIMDSYRSLVPARAQG